MRGQNKLIPCSKRLPKVEKKYLCQISDKDFEVWGFTKDLYKLDNDDFPDSKGVPGFYCYDSEWGFYSVDVIAWMELPEPYREDRN